MGFLSDIVILFLAYVAGVLTSNKAKQFCRACVPKFKALMKPSKKG